MTGARGETNSVEQHLQLRRLSGISTTLESWRTHEVTRHQRPVHGSKGFHQKVRASGKEKRQVRVTSLRKRKGRRGYLEALHKGTKGYKGEGEGEWASLVWAHARRIRKAMMMHASAT